MIDLDQGQAEFEQAVKELVARTFLKGLLAGIVLGLGIATAIFVSAR